MSERVHYTQQAGCICGHRLANHQPPTLRRSAGRCLRTDCACADYHWRAVPTDDEARREVKVYVLSRVDSYDVSEILGVYATTEASQAAAEASEPGQFDWQPMDGRLYASPVMSSGPIYSYSIEPFDVTE